jgi:hypothetical protein
LLETSDDHREGTPNPADPQVSSIAPNALRVGDHLLERLGAHVTAVAQPVSDERHEEVLS